MQDDVLNPNRLLIILNVSCLNSPTERQNSSAIYTHTHTHTLIYIHIYTHTYIYTYIYSYIYAAYKRPALCIKTQKVWKVFISKGMKNILHVILTKGKLIKLY